MNRTGLIVALSIAAIVGLVFGLYPELDLAVAAHFHKVVVNDNVFGWRISPILMWARNIGLWIGTIIVTLAVLALAIKLILPRRKLLMSGRAVLFLIATMAFGPGLLVNVTLKDHWGRSRPIDVQQFGGSERFVPWWDPRGECPNNCAFVSGDVAGTFWTLAPASLAPPQWRALAYAGALALGTGMAVMRVMAGAHFVSDVVFAGVFSFLVIWLMHGLIYRWPRTRLSDEGVERGIERIAMPGHQLVLRLFGRNKK